MLTLSFLSLTLLCLLRFPQILSICPSSLQVCMISQRKMSLETLHHSRELNPGHGRDKQWDTFIFILNYHDPGHGEDVQTMSYIYSPIELSWPGHGEDRQRDSFILTLSYHNPGHGEDRPWVTFILPLSYHDQAMERTDSEIHPFSHWAFMTDISQMATGWSQARSAKTRRIIKILTGQMSSPPSWKM